MEFKAVTDELNWTNNIGSTTIRKTASGCVKLENDVTPVSHYDCFIGVSHHSTIRKKKKKFNFARAMFDEQ